jgi:CMP-N,N'-diacetyllegionaminic acid synthase
MIGGSQVIAIVPARGGSKGIPGKNLVRLKGRSLLQRAIDTAREVACVDRVVVSTDDPRIAGAATAAGAEVHHRPAALATDTSRVIEALRHLCDTHLDPTGAGNALLLLLEPTCPLRAASDVEQCARMLAEGGCDSVATFTPAATNPWRAWRIEENRPHTFIPGAVPWLPRQELPAAYELSGGVYAFWRDNLRDPANEILCGEIKALIVPPERSLDIDTVMDLAAAEALLDRGKGPSPG